MPGANCMSCGYLRWSAHNAPESAGTLHGVQTRQWPCASGVLLLRRQSGVHHRWLQGTCPACSEGVGYLPATGGACQSTFTIFHSPSYFARCMQSTPPRGNELGARRLVQHVEHHYCLWRGLRIDPPLRIPPLGGAQRTDTCDAFRCWDILFRSWDEGAVPRGTSKHRLTLPPEPD